MFRNSLLRSCGPAPLSAPRAAASAAAAAALTLAACAAVQAQAFIRLPVPAQGAVPRPAPRSITQVMVKLQPGSDPAAFATHFSAAVAAPEARADGRAIAVSRVSYVSSIPAIGWHVFKLANIDALDATVAALKQAPGVLADEPDYIVRTLGASIPPPKNTEWHKQDWKDLEVVIGQFDDTESGAVADDTAFWTYSWHQENIRSLQGWSVYPGHYFTAAERQNLAATDPGRLPLVGVLDSGIDFSHYAFGYVVDVPGHTNRTTQSDISFGGQINTALARNYADGARNPNPLLAKDDLGHGTSTSGVIGATANTGFTQLPGIAFAAQIVPIKVIDGAGSGQDSDLVYGIIYAAQVHCVALNMSLDLDTTSYPQALADAIDYAWNMGTLPIAASGNDGADGTPPGQNGNLSGYVRRYPASMVHCLCVSATMYGGPGTVNGETIATYSDWGDQVGVTAPGGDDTDFINNSQTDVGQFLPTTTEATFIWTTAPTYTVPLNDPNDPNFGTYAAEGIYGRTWGELPGTSLACPHVVGVAAMYASANDLKQAPGVPQRILSAIEEGAFSLNGVPGGTWDDFFGYGRVCLDTTLNNANYRKTKLGGFVGQVTFGGSPLNNVGVTAASLSDPQHDNFSSTYPDGIYHSENALHGAYMVRAAGFGVAGAMLAEAPVGSDLHGVTFPLTSGSVTIGPQDVYLPYGGQQQYTAINFLGAPAAVNWSIAYGSGAGVDGNGLLSAPAHPTGGPYIAVVQASANTSLADMARVFFFAGVTQLQLASNPVNGGSPVSATVTISDPAPFGEVITLSSDNGAATVPGAVTIPKGSTSVTFTINTIAVTSSTTANITAALYGTSQTQQLTIN